MVFKYYYTAPKEPEPSRFLKEFKTGLNSSSNFGTAISLL